MPGILSHLKKVELLFAFEGKRNFSDGFHSIAKA